MPKKPFSSSTATKYLIALSGLGLFFFLLIHLAGNLMFFAGARTFNTYSHVLTGSPIVVALEVGLLLVFLLHVWKAVTNYRANRNARPVSYHKQEWAGYKSRRTPASWTMIFSGTVIFAFLVLHLIQFRFGTHYEVDGSHVRDLYRLEMEVFSNPLNVIFYVVAMVVLMSHLWHGVWSSLQSLGIGNSRFTPQINQAGKALASVIAGAFILIVIGVYVMSRGATP